MRSPRASPQSPRWRSIGNAPFGKVWADQRRGQRRHRRPHGGVIQDLCQEVARGFWAICSQLCCVELPIPPGALELRDNLRRDPCINLW
jgi:hypothetical protein